MAEQFLWAPADGSPVIDLTDESAGFSVEADGTKGLQNVEYRFATAQFAGIDGETVQAISAEANRISLGLLVQASSVAQLRQRRRQLVHAMRPKAGRGRLTVVTEEGERRSIACYLEGGLEGDESEDTTMPGRWWRVVLKLYAPDPWWEGDERTIDYGLAAPVAFFPLFPVKLSASQVQGEFTVDLSDCDTEAYPLWTVTGPGTSLVLENVSQGRAIEVTVTLAAGQQLIIDTRPGYQSVRRDDGTNLLPNVTSDPALWGLDPAVNLLSIQLAGATADSRIVGTYAPRYAGV